MRKIWVLTLFSFLVGIALQVQFRASAANTGPRKGVDGSVNPELIEDHAAYSLFFRILAMDPESERSRQLIVKTGISDSQALLAVVREFAGEVAAWDAEARDLKDRHWPRPPARVFNRLRTLQHDKNQYMQGVIASLPGRLGKNDCDSLEAFIVEEFKRGMRITPGPRTPQHIPSH